MNVKIQQRNQVLSPSLKKLIDRKSHKARRMLPTFRSHDLDLHLTLEGLSRGKKCQTTLVLTMPQTVIRVDEIEETPVSSLTGAFGELFRRIKKFKSQLNREKFWQRRAKPGGRKPSNDLPKLEQAINQNLDKIENYIRRALFHRAVAQDLSNGLLQPQALLDEVFVAVSSKLTSKPHSVPFEQWMFQVAHETVSRRLEQVERRAQRANIEEPLEESPTWDDDVLDFYQPDEVLHLEDLLPDTTCDTPEELLVEEEIEDRVHRAIAHLPKTVRESFVLFALEGFNSDEVAMITGKPPHQVRTEVEQARGQLRQQMFSG
ncbi:MAG: sigma-70 family RNA polymerase sigma factor [Acidobacteriota bacterium]